MILYENNLPGIDCRKYKELPDYERVDRIVLSVMVTTYNRAPILEYALKSIILQDFPKEMYEIIILDDASEIGDQDVIKKFIKEYSDYNIRAALMKKSKTFNEAGGLNIAFKGCRGEIYIRHQADILYLQNDFLSGTYRHHLVMDNLHLSPIPYDICGGGLTTAVVKKLNSVMDSGNLPELWDLTLAQKFPVIGPNEMGSSLRQKWAAAVRGYNENIIGNVPSDRVFFVNLSKHNVKFCVDDTLKTLHLPYAAKRPPSYNQAVDSPHLWHITDHPWGEQDVPIESVVSDGYRRWEKKIRLLNR